MSPHTLLFIDVGRQRGKPQRVAGQKFLNPAYSKSVILVKINFNEGLTKEDGYDRVKDD